jgi:lipopolysaccharide export system protein LptC
MNRRLLVITLLFSLGLLAHWLSGQREEAAEERAAAARHVAEYFLRDFVTTTMDLQGRPEQRLAAAQMLRYADDGAMELTAPQLTLYEEDAAAAPWQIDAARGHISSDGREVQLDGGVRVTRGAGDDRLELTTAELLLKPRERYAETDAPLTLTQPQGRVDAVGLRAYMKEGRLVLLAQVRGNYVPSP